MIMERFNKEALAEVADAIIEKPIPIVVREEVMRTRRFRKPKKVILEHRYDIAPPTMSKMLMIAPYGLNMKIDKKGLEENPLQECFRVCTEHIDDAAMIIAIATTDNSIKSLHDDKEIRRKAQFFRDVCYPSDFATVLMSLFSIIGVKSFMISINWISTLMLRNPTSINETGQIEK
jgi:hypothetical protein